MRSRGVLAVLTVLTFALPAAPAGAQLAGRIIAIAVAGPLTGGAAPFGVEQKQAVELAVDEQNATGGILGAKVALVSGDDRADAGEAKVLAQQFCDDARVLGVVGHVNSGVSVEASTVYKGCGLGMLTAMSSSPTVTITRAPPSPATSSASFGRSGRWWSTTRRRTGAGSPICSPRPSHRWGATSPAGRTSPSGRPTSARPWRRYRRTSTCCSSPASLRRRPSSGSCGRRAAGSSSPAATAAGTRRVL